MTSIWLLTAFALLIGGLVLLDIVVWRRLPRIVNPIEAWATYSLWLLAGAGFGGLLFYVYEWNYLNIEQELGGQIGAAKPQDIEGNLAILQYFACYLVEVALAVDNIAVLALLIAFFRVPPEALARTVFWSLLLSLLVRLGCILGCGSLLHHFPWLSWVLGAVLIAAMVRALLLPDEATDFNRRWFVRFIRGSIRIHPHFEGSRLCVRDESGRWVATPIVLIVLVAGLLDIVFAVDSVPALFSITRDPLIAFTASALANLGLRSLYLTLAHIVGRFRYLRLTTVFVLLFVAIMMFRSDQGHNATVVSIIVVSGIMLAGIGASALHHWFTSRDHRITESPLETRPAPIEDLTEAAATARRNLRKVVVLIIGTLVIAVLAPLVGLIPGPGGLIVAAAGLGILATEFIWARKLLIQVKQKTAQAAGKTDQLAQRTPVWVPPLAILTFVALIALLWHWAPYNWFGWKIKPGLVLALSVGPAVAIVYWAWQTIAFHVKRRRALRREQKPKLSGV